MKFLLFTDLHLGLNKNNQIWLDISKKFFQHILDIASINNVNNLICLGDFFDERKSIGTKTIDVAIEIADLIEKSNSKLYLIPGNHDLLSNTKLKPSGLSIFKKYKNIKIVFNPLEISNCILVPWNVEIENLKTDKKNIFGHFGIKSFIMNNLIECEETQYIPEMFYFFENVFSGHFHIKSFKKINNTSFYYLGSSFQQNFGDCNQERGFYIFDDELNTLEFFSYNEAPKFIKIMNNQEISKELIENNFIKITWDQITSTKHCENFINIVNSFNPIRIFSDFTSIKKNLEIENDLNNIDLKILDAKEILMMYVDSIKHPDFINKILLKSMLEKIIGEININEIGIK